MIFKNIEDLTQQTNEGLGHFCHEFQYYRKHFFNLKRAASSHLLFKFRNAGRDWVINPGGGIQLQYQLVFRGDYVMYGLGFNTQHVPHKNEKSPADYMQPYADAYLSQPHLEQQLLKNGFDYDCYNSRKESLKNLKKNQYILIGKKINFIRASNGFEMSDADFEIMLDEIKGLLFDTYKTILMNKVVIKRFDF
jgi:hypothetical protein